MFIFFRSNTEAVGNNNRGSGIWNRMAALIDCKSEDDYDQLCDLLISKYFPTGFQPVINYLSLRRTKGTGLGRA